MITFYDLAAQPSVTTSWSPHPWKVRYVLNFKKLSYKTVHMEFPDIADISKNAGIPPSWTRSDGVTPLYTSPAITDDTTGAAITDSYKIIEYLDKQYPNTSKVIPSGTEAFHAAFYAQFNQMIRWHATFLTPRVPKAILNPPSVEFYIRSCSELFGKPLAEVEPLGEARVEAWARVKANFTEVDGWMSKSPGQFFMGETPVFADFVVAGWLQGIKVILGEKGEEWKDIEGWHNGRWKNLLKNLERYEGPENEA